MPVSASGEKLLRSSSTSRISSSQSMSSGVNVTSPASTASSASEVLADRRPAPRRARRRRPRSGSARRVSPFDIGYQPSLASVRRDVAAGRSSSASSQVPSSMYERSAASTSSASVPAKQLPGSTSATSVRADRSRRFSVRRPVAGAPRGRASGRRGSQQRLGGRAPRRRRRAVCSTQVPTSGSLKRRCSIASSSSRAAARIHASLPAATSSSGVGRLRRRSAPRTVMWAAPSSRSIDTSTLGTRSCRRRSTRSQRRERDAGAVGRTVGRRRRGPRPARRRARRTCCAGRWRRRGSHSTACWPLTPSARVAKTSARSRRTWRLSTTRVSPPVPGSTAEQRHLGQRHGRRPVVDEHDLVARQRQLVAAAGGGAVDGGDPHLARSGPVASSIDVAGLVGELAEVDLVGVGRARQHLDVGAGAEHLVEAAGDDDRRAPRGARSAAAGRRRSSSMSTPRS